MFNNFIAIFELIMSVKIPDTVALLRALSNPLWIFLLLLFLVSEMAPTVHSLS